MTMLNECDQCGAPYNWHEVLLDFVIMAENEIQRIRTGYAPGPAMRDTIGQWQATVREARALLATRE